MGQIAMHMRRTWCWGFVALVLCAGLAPRGVTAEEPYAEFLAGLKSRGMHDMALAYLESLEQSSLISEEVRQTLLYERAITLLDAAKSQRDIPRRLEELEQSRQLLEQFVQQHPDHPLVASANVEQGQILLLRAKASLAMADTPGSSAADKENHRQVALQQFTTSRQVIEQAVKKLDQALQGFPKFIDSKDESLRDAREKTRNELLRAQLLLASVIQSSAEAHPPESAGWREALQQAATSYGTVYEAYARSGAAQYARLGQARCYQQLGEIDQALVHYEQLLQQPEEPEFFRELRTAVLRQAMECWNSSGQERYSETIDQGENWLAKASPSDETQPDWLAIRWHLAEAYQLRAEKLPEADKQRARDQRSALEQATIVSRASNEYQQAAREYVAARRNRDVQQTEVATFVEARDRGRDAIAAMQTANGQVADAQSQEQREQLQAELVDAREEAVHYLQLALSLSEAETPIEDINHSRYLLAFLYYQMERNYDAAVLGEFVAQHYPESSLAKRCAKIALAAYLRSWGEGTDEARQFDQAQMQRLAEMITTSWPESTEADEAWMMLADLALRQRQTAEAREYLANVAADSPRRALADLKAGQALWQLYLQASSLPSSERPASEQLQQDLTEAQQQLASGLANLPAGTPRNSMIQTAELSLAQLYATTGQSAAAVQLLERTPDGPLALAISGQPGIYAPGEPLSIELYKLALRAYVDQQNMPRAQEMMQQLERHVTESSADPAKLTRIYIMLGREIQQQVQQLAEQGKQAELANSLAGFELFLQRIADSQEGTTFNSLLWVGETFAGLADGLPREANGALSEASRKYQQRAADVYQRIITRGAESPDFVPSADAVESVRLRLAKTQRAQGNYQDAIATLVQILEKRPVTLEAQLEAAYTYQDWGAKEPARYQAALLGSTPVKSSRGADQNLIWGWARLAQILQGNADHQETYYEARYNLARCYYQLGMAAAGGTREQELSRAARAIEALARLDGSAMRDSQWYEPLDQLLKDIQQQQGKPPQGLAPILSGVTRSAG